MTTPAPPPALQLQGVTKSYGALQVLAPTDLSVAPGEFVTLLGPSGSGKTTILGIAAGITIADAGHVLAHGKDITTDPPHTRNVGMVFQRYTLFPNKTVAENVAFPLGVRRVPAAEARERVAHFLAMVGLAELADRYPSQISGGQAQRVALARALVFEPALLLMDEPLGALDRRLRQTLQEEIRRIQQETRVPTLYVTHDQEEAMSMSDRVVILRNARIVAEGAPRALYRDPGSLWAAAFLGDANASRVTALRRLSATTCHATTEAGFATVARLAVGAEVAEQFLVIRPEDCRLATDPCDDALPGAIEAISFLGPMQSARVRLACGWLLHAILPTRAEFSVGAAVWCHWANNAPIVVPAE